MTVGLMTEPQCEVFNLGYYTLDVKTHAGSFENPSDRATDQPSYSTSGHQYC